jgi:diguanylate cyclase (GGDEF)-like protein
VGHDSPAASPASLSPQLKILAECLRLIASGLKRAVLMAAPMALVVAVGLRGHVTTLGLGFWVGLIVAATALLVYVVGFEPPMDTPAGIENRRNEMITVVGLMAAAWGSAMFLAFPADPGPRLLLVVGLLGSMCAMSLGTFLVRGVFYAVVGPIAVPVIVRLALSGDSVLLSAAGVAAAVTTAFVVHGVGASRQASSLVRNRLENGLLSTRVEKLRERVAAGDAELDRVYEEMGEQQQRDTLTGTHNRRQFTERMVTAWQSAAAGFDPFSVAFVEVDNIGKIASTYGSETADLVIKTVSEMLDDALRTDDLLARINGAQFGLLLNNAITDGSLIALERIRRKLVSNPIDTGDQTVFVTVAMGLATYDASARPRDLLVRVDEALARARNTGTNRIVAWERMSEPASIL